MTNPIIQRELIGLLRTWQAFALQLALCLTLATLVLLRWPPDAQVNLSGDQAQQVLQLFAYGLMVGLILLAPVFPASSIVRERKQGTLALLLNSPLTPWNILFGKLVGVLGYVLILLLLSLPAATACLAMGGVSSSQLLAVYGVLALCATQYASIALYVSTRARSTDSALRVTYGMVLLLAVLTMGPQQFLSGIIPDAAFIFDWIRTISPIPAMMELLGQTAAGSDGMMTSPNAAWHYTIIAAITIVIFNILTLLRLNLRLFDQPHKTGVITDERSSGAQIFRRILFLWFFDPQRRSGLIADWANPVMIKEFRSAKFGRGYWMMRLFGGCLIVSLALMLVAAMGTEQHGTEKIGGILVILQVTLLVLISPSLASGLISTEREGRGWQQLQMTPLSAFSIVLGKLLSVARTMGLLILATLPGYVMLIWIDPTMMQAAIAVVETLLITSIFAVLVSATVSSMFARTAPATATSYTLLMVVCAGSMLVWIGRNAPFSSSTVEWVLKINPLAAALSAIRYPGFDQYHLLPANWYLLGSISVVSLIVLVVQTWRLSQPR